MSMPGAGDSYFYEWYVGLENVIKMLNPDSEIRCVVFQHDEYDTIDDVVVEYNDGDIQMCYQVKHNIETAAPKSLTFGSMLEAAENKMCLFEAMFQGWKKACTLSGSLIKPVLFTNRKLHGRRSGRYSNGKLYSAYSIDQFIANMQTLISKTDDGVSLVFTDEVLKYQWDELCNVLSEIPPTELLGFIKEFQIKGNQLSLAEMKRSLLASLSDVFSCEDSIALELFGRLLIGLTDWTTTGRKSREVTIEDVYAVLGVGEDVDESQHRLAYPYPFFESRQIFCEEVVRKIETTSKKVIFISGDPGSGKTSTMSFIQSEYNLFSLRFHTFRPISPEQHFYNADPGVCTTENLWGTLLIQLRKRLRGRLAKYHVPVSNKLLSSDEMRSQVMRLLGVLGQEAVRAGKKECICIDGIDHAARANIPVTFLSSLPLPSEIPDGVCFILAGQPAAMYQDQYPCWLSSGVEVEHISMPKLDVSDITQLILARTDQFGRIADELARLIYQKTEGNNLSAVFAVEEIRTLHSLDDVVAKLQQRCIGGDIQQYYNHIWAHMKDELSALMPSAMFPESIVACPLLLMNGRVNTRILSSALNYGISQTDWNMLLDRLYPLVIRADDEGEYSLFHNDFRVFLMGIIHRYQARFEEMALALANYLLDNKEGMLSYVMGIPLLQCAGRKELIPRYFTTEFVISALAEGISKVRLDEYAHLSYEAACENRDYIGYCNTYFAVKTMYQHKMYYECYEKEYKSNDYPEIGSIDISEIRTLPVKGENLDEFSAVLTLCRKLYSSDKEEHKERALRLYNKWFRGYSPISFVPICDDTISEENAWELHSTETGLFLNNWGTIAAKLEMPVPVIQTKLSKRERYAVFAFGEQYFAHCIKQKKYKLAIGAIKAGYVSQQAFSEKLQDIYYAGASFQFSDVLTRLDQVEENVELELLAISMKTTCDQAYVPDRSLLEKAPEITRIYDHTSFLVVLKSFLLGCIEKNIEDITLICLVDDYCAKIQGKETPRRQVVFLARTAALLGKYYWINDFQSTMLEGYAEWFLSARLHRAMDYSKARRFLLYTLMHSKLAQTLVNTDTFIDALRMCLFEIDHLGMYYKSWILDFLVLHDRHDIIKEYINKLYGDNCSRISQEENKADMHERFYPYGELVEPEMMRQFTEKLKWDVVGYVGYNEYALYAPLDCFEIITNHDPSRWRDLGKQLYEQSKIASQFSNQAAYDINNCITKVATACGITDYWELRKWDEEYGLNPSQINFSLFEFIKAATELKDLQAIWLLSCGIHSWYTQSERYGASSIYNACLVKAQELNVDFHKFVSRVTPQWESILTYISQDSREYTKEHQGRNHDISSMSAMYNDLPIDEAIDCLVAVERESLAIDHYCIVLEKVLACNEAVQERAIRLLHNFCTYLKGKDWTRGRYDSVIVPLLSLLGGDAFWAFAEVIGKQLSDYDYQISTRNMQFLLKLQCNENFESMESLFVEELRTQRIWVSGNNHFDINYDCESCETLFVEAPKSLEEMALYILLDQADTQNARKMEGAIYAIYLLGVQFPNIMNVIIECWSRLSQIQMECSLIVIARWAADGICSEALKSFLLTLYNDCAELSQKYYLHSILLKLNDPNISINIISYAAPVNSYTLPQDGIADYGSYYERFLSVVGNHEETTAVEQIRKYISEISPLESYKEDCFAEIGDSKIPAVNMSPGDVLYDKEKCGEWASIPLGNKKASLLPLEDPFILTEMPHVVFDSEWFPDIDVSQKEKNPGLSMSDLHDIAHSHIKEDEIVLAASLWYPWGHGEGSVYVESSKIDFWNKMKNDSGFDACIGNYGLLANEGAIIESFYTTIGTGGLSLFKRVGGNIKFLFGNCQLVPSSVWRSELCCEPRNNNPYRWVNDSGEEVLHFERVASPVREAMQEAYIRQPILFRWVCNKVWLTDTLQSEFFCLRPIYTQEPYPNFMD